MPGYVSNPFRAKFTLIVTALCTTPFLSAQINTGKITGIVTDSSGATVSDAAVRATNQETNVATVSKTQSNGDYLINFLIPGTYLVEVEAQGFRRSRESGVNVVAGDAVRLDLSLQIGEVRLRTFRPFQRLHVRLELNQIAADKSRREAAMAQQLAQQPRGIAARTAQVRERLLGRLHARFHPDQIFDRALELGVQVDQEVVHDGLHSG